MLKLRKCASCVELIILVMVIATISMILTSFTSFVKNNRPSIQNATLKQNKNTKITQNTPTIPSYLSIDKNQYVVNLLNKNDVKYNKFDKTLSSLNLKFKDIYNKKHKQIVVVVGNKIDSNMEQTIKNTLNNDSYISKLIVYDNAKNKLFYANRKSKVEIISVDETQFISWCTKLINDENAEYNKTLHEKSICINIIIFLVILDIILILIFFQFKHKLKVFKGEVINCSN